MGIRREVSQTLEGIRTFMGKVLGLPPFQAFGVKQGAQWAEAYNQY